MWKPEVEVFGTYKVHVTDDLLREIRALDARNRRETLASAPFGYRPEADTRKRFTLFEYMMSAVLIELTFSDTDPRYSADDFRQPDSEQAAYMVRYLSKDGESVVSKDEFAPPPEGPIRLGFFLHCFDSTKPLRTSYGEVQLPLPVEMPERLRRVFPYRVVT